MSDFLQKGSISLYLLRWEIAILNNETYNIHIKKGITLFTFSKVSDHFFLFYIFISWSILNFNSYFNFINNHILLWDFHYEIHQKGIYNKLTVGWSFCFSSIFLADREEKILLSCLAGEYVTENSDVVLINVKERSEILPIHYPSLLFYVFHQLSCQTMYKYFWQLLMRPRRWGDMLNVRLTP